MTDKVYRSASRLLQGGASAAEVAISCGLEADKVAWIVEQIANPTYGRDRNSMKKSTFRDGLREDLLRRLDELLREMLTDYGYQPQEAMDLFCSRVDAIAMSLGDAAGEVEAGEAAREKAVRAQLDQAGGDLPDLEDLSDEPKKPKNREIDPQQDNPFNPGRQVAPYRMTEARAEHREKSRKHFERIFGNH
jgi:hypothetical protein